MSLENDVAAWAKTHRACFKADPLIEMRGSERLQVGFTLDLYARLPMEKAPGAERREAGGALWKRLRTILESALAEAGMEARVDIEAMRSGAVLRPENEMQPEIALQARVFHGQGSAKAVTPAAREHMSALEKKLVAMGLKPGRW